MNDESCTQTASCEDGDHTRTWPCDYAPGTGRLAEQVGGVMDEEVDALLERRRDEDEQNAILVDGPIRRLPVEGDPGFLTTHVWDDEYFTTLRVLDHDPRPELVRDLFLARKRADQDPLRQAPSIVSAGPSSCLGTAGGRVR